MNYTRPEIVVLGKAGDMINFLLAKGYFALIDIIQLRLTPAYDLDE